MCERGVRAVAVVGHRGRGREIVGRGRDRAPVKDGQGAPPPSPPAWLSTWGGRQLLLIISGPPAAGKTTLGRRIAGDFQIPFVAKDDIKEALFDSLGCSDLAWSRRLGRAGYELLYRLTEAQLVAGRSLAIESNFSPEYATAPLLRMKAKYGFEPLQILCQAEEETLLRRYRARVESGERHPGHVDHLNYENVRPLLRNGRYPPLDLGGTVIEVDTNDVSTLDYDALLERIVRAIGR
jgi:predicted kinase